MIKKIVRSKEIAVAVINEIGALSKITSFLMNHGINIEAVAGYATPVGEKSELVFVTDNNIVAIDALAEHDFKYIRENDIIIVELENRPGNLKNISECLAQNGINITYIYATTCVGGCPTKIVLSTSDNDKTMSILRS